MELHRALSQISQIRRQTEVSGVYQGYRPLTVGLSGLLGIAAAVLQPHWVAAPGEQLGRYLILWLGVATIGGGIAGLEIFVRVAVSHSRLTRRMTITAVEQFLPCLVVGALLTVVVSINARQVAWTLPGLWGMVFGLGIFSSQQFLPRAVCCVGIYYVTCGFLCLWLGQGEAAFSPWTMGATFGGGQLLAAAVLYWTNGRPRDEHER